jgi:hypothetical protein
MQQDKDLECLDEMIADLGRSKDAVPWDLLLEHLQAARRYLLGSMPREYSLSLQQARESVALIPDKIARSETKKILRSLIDSKCQNSNGPRPPALGMRYPAPAPLAPAR